MFTNTKIALAAALILGTACAAQAQQNVGKSHDGIVMRPSNAWNPNSGHARGSFAQSTESTGAARSLTPFEKTWFDFQNHGDQ